MGTPETVQITLKGASFTDVIQQAKQLVEAAESFGGKPAAAAKTRKAKAAPEPEIEEDEIELADEPANGSDDEDELSMDDAGEDDELSFDDEEEVEEAPAKAKGKTKEAPAKAKKITKEQVNQAALAHAKKHKRAETMKLLKKNFGVQSIGEIKESDFAKALKVLTA